MGAGKSTESRHCTPTGTLYAGACPWELKVLRKQIVEKKLAPIFRGAETESAAQAKGGGSAEECPICNLWYTSLNKARCCREYLCTECYIHIVKRPGDTKVKCPFCSVVGFSASFVGPKPATLRQRERTDSQLYAAVLDRRRAEAEAEAAKRAQQEEQRRQETAEEPTSSDQPLDQQQQAQPEVVVDQQQQAQPDVVVDQQQPAGADDIDPDEQAMIDAAIQLSLLNQD